MIRLTQIADRYEAAGAVARGIVELDAVSDAVGAQLDIALKRLIIQLREEDPEIWQELLAVARQLRWRLATNPAPAAFRVGDDKLLAGLEDACQRRKLAADQATQTSLEDLARRAEHACVQDRPMGKALLESLRDLNYESCVVVTASGRAQSATRDWFDSLGISVPVLRGSFREQAEVVEQAYAVGWPVLFGPALLTAPRARSLAYVLPSWVQDRTLPTSALADYAEGAIRPARKIFKIGTEPVVDEPSAVVEDQLTPLPVWSRHSSSRAPRPDEVLARKVLLGGELAIMLDEDGEHIRSLYPDRPAGQRVELGDVSAITVGSYLVLREGITQSAMLYDWAIELLGDRGPNTSRSQEQWKNALQAQLDRLGTAAVTRELEQAGVRRADRAAAWTSITLVRPQDDQDFERLLNWLGLPTHPHFELATALRRARQQASQDIREILEDAVSTADLAELERDGFIRIELDVPGFRSIIATRVLAISPELEPVQRREIRLPREDWGARWLE
jgi:hypothetical protein